MLEAIDINEKFKMNCISYSDYNFIFAVMGVKWTFGLQVSSCIFCYVGSHHLQGKYCTLCLYICSYSATHIISSLLFSKKIKKANNCCI